MAKILQYEVTQQLERAEKKAKTFVGLADKFASTNSTRTERIVEVGGMKPFWIIMSFVGIPLAIVFGIYEAFMAETAIISFLDPLGGGTVNHGMVQMIGAGLAVFAMFMGHIFIESLQGEKHIVTGRVSRKTTPLILAIIGLLGYVFFQYKLVMAAGDGGSEFNSFAMVAIGVACLEILVGVLILGKAFTYLLIFIAAFQLWYFRRGMNKNADGTKSSYRDYTLLLQNWNSSNPNLVMLQEGNNNISKAILFHDGSKIENANENINDPSVKDTTPNKREDVSAAEMDEKLKSLTQDEDDQEENIKV
ncbi:MAG: hypothetical protein IPL20_03290 [Saprospiraceae bacterium]|nr:hypothetical protein [Saprospiraceae bacterium]